MIRYRLDVRIARSDSWLKHCWRKAGKPDPKPNEADTLYQASMGIIEKALRFEVDCVLIVSAMYVHPDFIVLLKRAHIRLAILFTESPYDDRKQLRLAPFCDLFWVNERTSVPIFKKVNPNSFYLPHAYDPAKHHRDMAEDEEVPAHDVVFVGTGFQERIDLLSSVDWTGIDFGLYGSWEMLGSRHRLRRHLRKKMIDNTETAALYRRAKIGLNLHRTSVGFGKHAPQIKHAESLNPRAYELAACGRFFVSDYRAECEEKFGRLVPMFRGPDELGGMIRQWLDNEAMRKVIGNRLPYVVQQDTWADRAVQVTKDLERVLQRPRFRAAKEG